MLILSRNRGEAILIGSNIAVTVVDVYGGQVRLSIEAPKEVAVDRAEIRARKLANPRPADGVQQTTQNPGSLITENPPVTESINIDDHVKLARDAARYRHLRDRECIEDASTDLLVMAGDTYFTGAELDKQIDDAIRLTALLERHGEPA